jgi:hypothetical protein
VLSDVLAVGFVPYLTHERRVELPEERVVSDRTRLSLLAR